MNNCLSLPNRQGAGGARVLTGWESLRLPLGEGEDSGLALGRGAGWEPAQVPGQLAAVEGKQAVWYRTTFARPDHSGRVLLRFGGSFLATNVWLNGRMLGSHYGYFGAFGFDVTPFLKGENLLVVCCETPIETDLSRKHHVLGIFADGDSRPYPSSTYFSLPPNYLWEVPLGLWRPVELEYLGPVALDWLRLKPRLEAGDVGRLDVEARLRNLDGREMSGEVAFEARPPDGRPIRLGREFALAGGLERSLTFSVSLPDAQRWWPWRLGEPATYGATATVSVEGRPSAVAEDHFGFRELEVHAVPESWSIRVNGQPIFLRGANYIPDLRLDRLSVERFEADLALARATNLDALRVHGHVLPAEFYRCADQAGMLVVADFPLTGAYAYHAAADEATFFETAVREQVPEMVELLRNRPSVAWWVVHDEPPWIPASAELGDVHAVRQNYTIDQEAKALFERHDPSRTALAASGELDRHIYAGWKEAEWTEFAGVEAGLVSEFGAQALPSAGSPVWRALGASARRWPVDDSEPQWLYAGFQPVSWADHGVGLPSEHASLEGFIEASQRYQAWVVGYGAEQMRMRKFEPCWGAFVYQLVDPFPAIGFSLADSERVPKLALEALRDAMAPTRIIVDAVGFELDRPYGIRYRSGRAVVIRLIVVNDDPGVAGPARVRWWVERKASRRGGRPASGMLRDALRRKSYSGTAELELPEVWEPAVQLASLSLPLEAQGEYRMAVELTSGGRVIDRSSLDFRVGPPRPPSSRGRQMPGYLSERLVKQASLARDGTALGFALLNQTRPAVLGSMSDFHLDGHLLAGASVHLEGGIPLPRRLELPVGRELRLLLESQAVIAEGRHRLEFHLTVPGVGSGMVTVEGDVL